MNDETTVHELKRLCRFRHEMTDGHCTLLSFYDDEEAFGGTIRHHSDKATIWRLIASLPHLSHLNLRKCKMGKLDGLVSRNIEYLDISCNDLESVPDWIASQPLKFLNLGANRLASLPDLTHLPLETLKIHKNRIVDVPFIFGLKVLNVYLNPIVEFPVNPSLEVLTAGVTTIDRLPDLGSMTDLRWLTFTVNQIRELPDDICTLSKLEGLVLAKNKIERLPERFGELNINTLSLYSNDIAKLPESFYDLRLKKVNLSRNEYIST